MQRDATTGGVAMTELTQAGQTQGEGLSQIERVFDTYVSPTKTFQDIRRSASWWLPFVLGIIVGLLFIYSVDRQIGFEQVAQASVNNSQQMQDRLSTLTDAQREHAIHNIAAITRISSYGYPIVALIIALICAGVLMASFNLGMGAQATYKQYLAVWFYASLPYLIKFIVAAIAIFAGASAEQFDIRNPVGSNIGWYLSSDVPLWIRTALSSIDIFTIWVVILLVLGCAAIARVKRSSAALIVVGWWVLIILVSTTAAAFQS